MDITEVFRSYVKNFKLQRSLTGVDKQQTLKFKNKRDEFTSKSKGIVYHITKLKDCLQQHRKQFVGVSLRKSIDADVDDRETEEIDAAASNIIRNCTTLLKELNVYVDKNPSPTQLYEHRKGVLEIVQNYLKFVCKMYAELKETYSKRRRDYNEAMKVVALESRAPTNNPEYRPVEDLKSNLDQELESSSSSIVGELSAEELQMFEIENADLISQLNNLTGEVNAIEKKITHIAGLQDTFTEMVLQQDFDIQRIDSTVIGTTENVQDANAELRKAVQNQANFRFYYLFFILTLSFTLLFLHWYNE